MSLSGTQSTSAQTGRETNSLTCTWGIYANSIISARSAFLAGCILRFALHLMIGDVALDLNT